MNEEKTMEKTVCSICDEFVYAEEYEYGMEENFIEHQDDTRKLQICRNCWEHDNFCQRCLEMDSRYGETLVYCNDCNLKVCYETFQTSGDYDICEDCFKEKYQIYCKNCDTTLKNCIEDGCVEIPGTEQCESCQKEVEIGLRKRLV